MAVAGVAEDLHPHTVRVRRITHGPRDAAPEARPAAAAVKFHRARVERRAVEGHRPVSHTGYYSRLACERWGSPAPGTDVSALVLVVVEPTVADLDRVTGFGGLLPQHEVRLRGERPFPDHLCPVIFSQILLDSSQIYGPSTLPQPQGKRWSAPENPACLHSPAKRRRTLDPSRRLVSAEEAAPAALPAVVAAVRSNVTG